MTLTQARLKEVLYYDHELGWFMWLISAQGIRFGAGTIAGTPKGNGYLVIRVDGVLYLAHRLAWLYMTGEWPTQKIDHKLNDGYDNTISNLRDGSIRLNAENQRRARRDNKAGLLGVSQDGRRWRAQISVVGQNKYLGTFSTPQEAHHAYVQAKRKFHEGCML